MDEPKIRKFRVTDPNTGKTLVLSGTEPPTPETLDEIFAQYKPKATAQTDATATPFIPDIKPKTRTLGETVGSMTKPAQYLFDPIARATTPPQKMAEDVGTALEVGLPFLASPLPSPARIPLSGALQGTGTMLKESMVGAAKGQPVPIGTLFEKGGESALYGAGGEAFGNMLGAGAKKALSPFSKQVNPEAMALSKKYGIKPLPSEVWDEATVPANVLKQAEDVSSRSLLGAGIVEKRRLENYNALERFKKDVLDKIAPETQPTKLKELVTGAIRNNENAFREIGSHLYAKVDEAAQGVGVNLASVKAFAQKALAEIPEKERIAAKQGGAEASALMNQLERISQLPENIPFKDAEFYRSQLLATVRGDKSPIGGRIKGSSSKLAGLFDSDMKVSAQKAGSEAHGLYQQASNFWKQGKDLFNSDVVAGIAEKDPEQLAKYVFSPRSGEDISRVREALNPTFMRGLKKNVSPETWNRFKRAGVEEILSKKLEKISQSTGDPYMRGANLYQELKSFGDEALSAFLEPAEKNSLMQFAKMASRVSTKEPSVGAWGIVALNTAMTNVGLAGMGYGAITGDPMISITSAGILLGTPGMYAKLITSNAGRRWLTEGFNVKPGTQNAINFMSRFLTYLNSPANKPLNPQPSASDLLRGR